MVLFAPKGPEDAAAAGCGECQKGKNSSAPVLLLVLQKLMPWILASSKFVIQIRGKKRDFVFYDCGTIKHMRELKRDFVKLLMFWMLL